MCAEYEELRIRLLRVGPGRYLVFANGPASAAAVIDLPDPERFVRERNDLLREEFGHCERPPGAEGPPRKRLQALGEKLFGLLFPKPIDACLRDSLAFAARQRPVRHLRLRFFLEEELRDLPVELLRAPDDGPLGFLALHPTRPDVSIVRSLPGGEIPSERLPSAEEERDALHLLIVAAAPRGWELANAAHEVANLLERLDPLYATGFVEVEVLASPGLADGRTIGRATRARLAAHAAALHGPSAVLVIAHGYFDADKDQGVVVLEDEHGDPDPAPVRDEFAGLLARAPGLRLAVLNLCRGTQTRPDPESKAPLRPDPFVGAAQALIAAGVPAVVAMQFEIGDGAAAQFSPVCLERIARNATLDEAVRLGRRALANVQEGSDVASTIWTTTEWCIPSCLVHEQVNGGGWLFKVKEVYDDAPPPDPFAQGQTAVDAFTDAPRVVHAIPAIRYLRLTGNWARAANFCKVVSAAAANDDVLKRLHREAQTELAFPKVRDLCAHMTQGEDGPARLELRKVPAPRPGVFQTLEEEIQEREKRLRLYETALGHEKAARWDESAALFEGLAPFRDAPARGAYARCRLREDRAETGDDWAAAADAYDRAAREHPAGVSPDAGPRGAYCRGRAAEAAGRAAEAADAYQRAADSLLYKDGRARLCHAKARACAEAENWEDAISWYEKGELAGGPAVGPKTTADPLGDYLRGRAAEGKGEWEAAAAAYEAPAGAGLGDAVERLRYCRGRAADRTESWQEVMEHLEGLGKEFPDAASLRSYARGRSAQALEEWQTALEAYAAVPAGFRDVKVRQAYCLGRREEQRRQWQPAADAYRLVLDGPAPPRDTAEHLERCLGWVKAMEKLKARQWVEAARGLPALSGAGPRDLWVSRWLQWCREARVVVPILEKMAAGPLVRDPEVPWEGGPCPYEVLADRNVSPSTALEASLDGPDPAQLSAAQRAARDALQSLERRLALDFTLYTVHDPARADALVGRLTALNGADEPLSLDRIAAELGADEGVFWALLKEHGRAVEFFRAGVRERPDDRTRLHHLGLAAAGKAFLTRRGEGEPDIEDWRNILIGWGPVFAADAFWEQWGKARAEVYRRDLRPEQVQEARARLRRYWLGQLAVADGPERPDVLFHAEVAGAQALEAAGGLPVAPGRLARLGPLGVKALGFSDALAAWAAALPAEGWADDAGRRPLGRYFSELAEAAALFEAGRFKEVVAALTRPRCEHQRRGDALCARPRPQSLEPCVAARRCFCFRTANPVWADLPAGEERLLAAARELLESARLQLAHAALAAFPPDLAGAFDQWTAAVDLARLAGRADTVLAQVRDAAVRRARYLGKLEEKSQPDGFNGAVDLLRQVRDIGWDGPDRAVQKGLVDAYLDRAIYLSNVHNIEQQAREDALIAYEMDPQNWRAVRTVCLATCHFAREKFMRGETGAARWLLRDAVRLFGEAEQTFPGHPGLRECRDTIEEVKRFDPDAALPLPPPPQDGVEQQYAEAKGKEGRGDFAGAIGGYRSVLELDAGHRGARASLPWCYRFYILSLSEKGQSDDARRIAVEARGQFAPDHDALADLFEGMELA